MNIEMVTYNIIRNIEPELNRKGLYISGKNEYTFGIYEMNPVRTVAIVKFKQLRALGDFHCAMLFYEGTLVKDTPDKTKIFLVNHRNEPL